MSNTIYFSNFILYNVVMEQDQIIFDKKAKAYKHVFFDVDQTLTRSRSLIEPSMKEVLEKLCNKHDVIIVSGAKEEQIWKQVTKDFVGKVYILAQNGNSATDKQGQYLWKNVLNQSQKDEIFNHIKKIKDQFGSNFKGAVEEDTIQDRGCQVSFSCIGHNANLELKEAFDPKGELRQSILRKIPFNSQTLEVKIGGTTCFDYFELGKHKGKNVSELFKKMNWNREDSVYIGDALFPGGNDESVIGVCDTLQVSNPFETQVAIRKMI